MRYTPELRRKTVRLLAPLLLLSGLLLTSCGGSPAVAPAPVPTQPTGPPPAPAVRLSVTKLAFSNTVAGARSTAATVQLSNTGTATLDLTTVSLSGTGASGFQQSNDCGSMLPANGQCTFTVVFTPPFAGNYVAALGLEDNDTSTPQNVNLSGVSLADTPLSTWDRAYAQCRSGVLNVLVLGDSRSIVDNTIVPGVSSVIGATFGQKWPDRLASSLAATCGSHGSGLVPFLALAQNQMLNQDFFSIDGSWVKTSAIGPFQTGGVPAGTALIATSALTIDFHVAAPFDHLNGYCAAGPGLNPWTLLVDGSPVGACGGPAGTLVPVLASSSPLAATPHSAALRCTQAPCVAYGMETTVGTTGVSLHNLSIASCTAECFGLNPAVQLGFSDLIVGHHLVIVDLITNEPGVGYSTDSFATSLSNILRHEQSLPVAPSVLLTAPLQDSLGGQAPYYAALPGVAASFSATLVDMRAAYGTSYLPQYFGPDQVHENNAGHDLLFRKITQTLLP